MRFLIAAGALAIANLLVAMLLPAHEADAGSALRLELGGLVERSELILEARVLASRCIEEEGLLLTESLLEVTRTLKGPDLAYRSVRLPGGVREDGSGMLVPGVPGLVPGSEALLFLGPEGRAGVRLPTGLAQGVFDLRTDTYGRKQLVRDSRTLGLLEPGGGEVRDGATGIVDYAALIAAVEAAASSGERR